MAALELIRTFVEYNIDMTRRVWSSIDQDFIIWLAQKAA